MIVWRTKSNNPNVASTRYRVVYPAWFLSGKFGIDSRFVSGRTDSRMLNGPSSPASSAIVFAKHFSRQDLALARKAKARGFRIVYDQCDNFFAKDFHSKRDNPQTVVQGLPVIDALVFPTRALRDVFVENGFPPAKCHVIPDPMIDGEQELAALAWSNGRFCHFKRLPLLPARQGWNHRHQNCQDIVLPPKTAERIVWFGATSSKFGKTGLDLLAETVPALNAIAASRPIELVIVTGDLQPCGKAMAAAEFRWKFVPWSVGSCIGAIRSADACLLPVGDDAFAKTKSANRVLMAAANGVPAITNPHPSIAGFEDAFFIANGNAEWGDAIEAALDSSKTAHKEAGAAREGMARLHKAFGGDAIAGAWASLLDIDCKNH